MLAVVGVLVAGAAVTEMLVPTQPADVGEDAGQASASAGTWYCPVTAARDENAVLDVAAIGREPSTVVISRYQDGKVVDDPPVVIAVGDALEVPLSASEATAPLAVRWKGGPAVAHWRLDGAADTAAARCESGPSSTWYLTGFNTTVGATSTLHLFNPYGEDAVARLRFATPDGPVDLVIADNQLVKAGRSATINLAEFQPEEPDLGVTVEVLSGRLVAQGQVVLDPPGDADGPTGRALFNAALAPALGWGFGQVRADDTSSSWLSIQNPSEREAAIEVRVTDPQPNGNALLGETSVPAGGVVRLELAEASAQPEFGVSVVSVNETPVVVSGFSSLRNDQGRGLSATLGAPGPATEWAAVGGTADRTSQVSIFNPGAEEATITMLSPEGRLPQWTGVVVRPNEQVTLDLVDAGADRSAVPVRVVSDLPVVVELRSVSESGPPLLWTSVGVPAVEWTGPPTRPIVRRDPTLKTSPVASPPPEPEPELNPTEFRLSPLPDEDEPAPSTSKPKSLSALDVSRPPP